MKVYGPYLYSTGPNKGRKFVTIIRDDGSKTSMLYSRFLWIEANGPIPDGLEVDHIDEDKTNDSLENFQLLSSSDNARKGQSHKETEILKFECPQCGLEAEKPARHVRHSKKQGKAGPFCSRSCAGKWSTTVRLVELADTRI